MICINIDIVLHHATIKRYFDSFLTRRATLRCVGQKCVRPPPQFFLPVRLWISAMFLVSAIHAIQRKQQSNRV